ncbi:MAG: hypothetical protein BroJett003_11700 [Planctomycetota bacterium]|nr:MAG: hypothetical protein BroJett003_11700 [Planctomycetota bacterium]
MSKSRAKKLAQRKRRIGGRLRVRQWSEQARPMFKARHIRYELTDKARGLGEEVAEFEHAPQACRRSYRMIVVRKRIAVEKGQERLFTDYRYFFTITNDRAHVCSTVVETAHGRCDQENLIDQLKHGVHALRMPVGDLVSHWAYMVMAALAWSLKASLALWLRAEGRWKERHKSEKQSVLRMEFKTFMNAFIRAPALGVREGRRVVFKLLSWNPWQHVLLRAAEALCRPLPTAEARCCPLRC